jgi:hypothetical protein
MNSKYIENLRRQLEMNPHTWTRLISRGIKENAELELDFSFIAHDEIQGKALALFFIQNFPYKIDNGHSGFNYIVQGTVKMNVSLEGINRWVEWMCEKGAEFQSLFDGWGTSI